MIKKFHSLSLTNRVFIAMGAAIVAGSLFNYWSSFEPSSTAFKFIDTHIMGGALYIIGTLFLNALKMVIVPLVLVSLITGVTASQGNSNLGRISAKTLALYVLTTAVAIALALLVASMFSPGEGIAISDSSGFKPSKPTPVVEILANLIPSNPISAMVEGNMLQIIVFAIIIGIAINHSGKACQSIADFVANLNTIMLKLVHLIMELAPYGVFALVSRIFGELGLDAVGDLAEYMAIIVAVLFLHAGLTYISVIAFVARLNPIPFLKKMIPAQLFAFSTASSSATMPVTMETCEKSLGVDNRVASFSIPLGATINMDGTAIMQGVATVFIANIYGIDLGLTEFLMVIMTATLASIGTAGIPSAGMITLTMVLAQANLPAEPIAMILGVDRILDMIRTAINITGDAAVTVAVAKSEDLLDMDTYNKILSENSEA